MSMHLNTLYIIRCTVFLCDIVVVASIIYLILRSTLCCQRIENGKYHSREIEERGTLARLKNCLQSFNFLRMLIKCLCYGVLAMLVGNVSNQLLEAGLRLSIHSMKLKDKSLM